ncbi:MAG: nucleoside transporter [Caldithrix sp. RBG_13_44_9]|nr:MAG: nucleoside transporter [Caldithrix sp. RBG_13_44_9]
MIIMNFLGFFTLLIIAWLLSNNRKIINWRVVFWGLILQIIFAFFIFVIPVGTDFFLLVNRVVLSILDSATAGTTFLFGRLALPPGSVSSSGESSLGFFLALQALPTIIFFAALVGILYYLGIMQKIIQVFAYAFTRLMRISGAESLCAASNIFVGVESALVIRPFLQKMTRSELCTVLTAGMATVASSMLAVYIFMLKAKFPTIAGHLVSASIMNAPSAIVMSKLLLPETGTPETLGQHVNLAYEKESNFITAIINNANSGVKLVVGICALLLAFLGLMALVDKIFVFTGGFLNDWFGIQVDWTLKGLLGYLFYPFTLLIGIPLSDAGAIAKIIGERLIVTEVTAFQDLANLLNSGVTLSPRSVVITTYALTGFAHVASLAIFVGGISALVPERLKDLSQLGFRALLGATLACLMTACIAGFFYTDSSILLK